MIKYTCICGSTEFYLVETSETYVDFGREGDTKGHPYTGGKNTWFKEIHCGRCKTIVPRHIADKMRREII